jgi:AcrR family transcriptional regulator
MTDDTRAAIRDVALELFSRQGYQKTSLREIAERLGITKAALYYHYPSKQALLLAIIEPLLAEWKTVVDKATAMTHNRANVERAMAEQLDVLLRHRAIAGMFTRDAPAVLEAIGQVYEELFDLGMRFNGWLAGPNPTAADRIRAIAATEALSAALGWGRIMQDISDEETRAVLLESATTILWPRGPSRS